MIYRRNTLPHCYDCGIPKEENKHLFYKAKENKDGLQGVCKVCAKKRNKSYRKRTHQHEKDRERLYLKNYGLTLNEYDQMLKEQENRCAICKTNTPGGKGRFHVDHCHESNAIRGLLCHHCNLMLGHAKDNINTLHSAIDYLKVLNEC